MKRILLCTCILWLSACSSPNANNGSAASPQTPDQTASPETQRATGPDAAADRSVAGNSDIERLIGNWFMPHSANINMSFTRDGRFVFHDYNTKLGQDETLTGKYELKNGELGLLYDDRPKQTFRFYKGEGSDKNYYIKHGTYYFVKGENGSQN